MQLVNYVGSILPSFLIKAFYFRCGLVKSTLGALIRKQLSVVVSRDHRAIREILAVIDVVIMLIELIFVRGLAELGLWHETGGHFALWVLEGSAFILLFELITVGLVDCLTVASGHGRPVGTGNKGRHLMNNLNLSFNY
jgi:hypothetical protein